MSSKKKQLMNFGKFCKVVKAHYGQMTMLDEQMKMIVNNQEGIISLLYYCGLEPYLFQYKFDSRGYASDIYNSRRSIPREYIENISNPYKETECLDKIKKIFSTSVLKKKELIQDLIEIICNIDNFEDVKATNISTSIDEQAKFFLKCLRYVVNLPNTNNQHQVRAKRKEMISKYNLQSGDPFGISNTKISKSSSLKITVVGYDLKKYHNNDNNHTYLRQKDVIVFHHFESCLTFIMDEGFSILDIKVEATGIRIIVYKSNYILKRIERHSDFVEFLKPYIDEFIPKVSWHGMNISEMANCGFEKGIWIPYGYYDNGKLIAVCDYKIRLDQNIEIGIVCVDKNYRGEDLAKSFLYFFRLMFFSSGLYSGTHNKNDNMINAFIGTGFRPMIFDNIEDENIQKGTNKMWDRLDKEKFYSVYYTSDPLWNNDSITKSNDKKRNYKNT